MNFHFSQGATSFPDGRSVKYKELEFSPNRSACFVIRIYPSNTFLSYRNEYGNWVKTLKKAPHQVAQQYMGKWLQDTFDKMRLRVGGAEFESVMAMYKQLVNEPLR